MESVPGKGIEKLAKCNGRLSDQMSLVLDHRDLSNGVDFFQKPGWFLLQVDFHQLVRDLLGYSNQLDSLHKQETSSVRLLVRYGQSTGTGKKITLEYWYSYRNG